MENKIIVAESERLILRRYKKEDIQDLFEYLSDKEVVKYEPYIRYFTCLLDKGRIIPYTLCCDMVM